MNTKSIPPRPTLTTATMPDYDLIRQNYLAMLATSNLTAEEQAYQAIVEMTASPEFQSLGDNFAADFSNEYADEPLFDDDSMYLSPQEELATSPIDTPFSTFIPTPLMGMQGDFDEPLITDTADGDNEFIDSLLAFPADDGDVPAAKALPPGLSSGKLYTFSPSTPMLDSFDSPLTTSSSLSPSIPITNSRPVIPPAPRRRSRTVPNATGTRKNISPGSLIPLDAPTQRRNYRTASATSRKKVPVGFKRSHRAAFGDEDEDDEEAELSPTLSDLELIEAKRRQNTLAARKSRKRKLEHTQMLEGMVEELKSEVTTWRERALMAQEMLRGRGIELAMD
ncbi:hypothetical protein C8F01DRAFT_1111937 [Mycena amicta]|nr:hypothetical protein C8F01DRAFT_1111937 [Mycena amicta]